MALVDEREHSTMSRCQLKIAERFRDSVAPELACPSVRSLEAQIQNSKRQIERLLTK
jgi:hypothetical protein